MLRRLAPLNASTGVHVAPLPIPLPPFAPMPDSKAPEPSEDTPIRPGDSILDAIAHCSGRAPMVNLRDAGTGEETPIIDPKARSFQNEMSAADQGKYRILGEIARGGMGVVLRGHDVELGRDIALKVTDAKLAKRPEVIERFIEEAQIGGQLQHPGIVPVYELGLMADERPYFTMKLIKGRTLAAMLTRRKSVDEDRVGFLRILESVCQTMAYAHSKGVIHRDLKPANIMVGAFGEVQVVDWGLSKVLRRGGVDDEIEARDTALSVIETVRSGPGSGTDSLVGSVLGTPAYMSPEQAQGDPHNLDERTDVFALGAILCEILTGAPAYVAKEGENIVQMAALAELDDARARIEASTASKDLKKVCQSALLTSRAARPRDAEELANSVHEHLAGLETRAHEAQLAAAEERVKAESSRRKSQLLLMVGVVVLLAGGGWWAFDQQQQARSAELADSFADMQDEALQYQREGNFVQAVEVARSSLRLVEAGDSSPELRARANKLIATAERSLTLDEERLAKVERERELFDFLLDIGMRLVNAGFDESPEDLEVEYEAAFHAYGFDLGAEDASERLMATRDTAIGIRLARGFDDWARLHRGMDSRDSTKLRLLTGLGLDLDSDPLRTAVRLALVEGDTDKLLALAREVDFAKTPEETLILIGFSLRDFNQFELARSVFVRGANQHPTSYLLNYGAGHALYKLARDSNPEVYLRAGSYLRAALALRPDLSGLHVLLGDFYNNHGNAVLSAQHLALAIERTPDHGWNPYVLAQAFRAAGQYEESIQWYQRDLEPGGSNNAFSTSAIFTCELLLGRTTIEEFIAWADSEVPGLIFPELGPVLALVDPGFAGLDPDPERALQLLERHLPEGVNSFIYWSMLGMTFLLLGDAEGALAAREKKLIYDDGTFEYNMGNRIRGHLFEANLARLLGKHEEADFELMMARRIRDELISGMEEEWKDTPIMRTFDYYEARAARR